MQLYLFKAQFIVGVRIERMNGLPPGICLVARIIIGKAHH